MSFLLEVFQQIPETLLVKGSLQKKNTSTSSYFYFHNPVSVVSIFLTQFGLIRGK
ncbi:unnamed protein product [Cuscuta europaea]|uniref:Uncharacterized protein n=1 Tax=Cuscuta europaea TaxID=41803 RepID=A0A9P0ZAI2_CUSEU|nr:unnamed protein product [Cuscuta europaea]